MATVWEEARDELESEFEEFRDRIPELHEAVDRLIAAEPTDDVYDLLESLEDLVKDIRTGGLIGSGAKGHRKALARYRELMGSASE